MFVIRWIRVEFFEGGIKGYGREFVWDYGVLYVGYFLWVGNCWKEVFIE